MLSRRAFLSAGGLAGGLTLTACSSSGATSGPSPTGPAARKGTRSVPRTIAYGSDPSQVGELWTPVHPFHAGVAVIVHGGFWRAQYGLDLGRPLAANLAYHGWTVWNLEYRRVGNGGGWPATFEDIAAGIDHLAALDVDTSAVAVVGHSAGGHLAVWAAGRGTLPAAAPGASPKVTVTGVVSQAGVLDLAVAQDTGVGSNAEAELMGGTPAQVPDRYRLADPIARVPIPAPVLCLHSRGDQNVPYSQSTAYVAAARKAGGKARLHRVDGDHFTLIDPASKAWAVVVAALPELSAGTLAG